MYRVAGSQSTRPQYQEIAERLQADILGGRWAVGDQLDPETTLADHHHVSRFTLRQALSLLEERGLVSRKRRVGTVVVRTNLPEIMVQQLSSMDELLQYPPQTRLETLKC
uniref:GntR family transcriptional regulator n=1 Tax=Polymorphobacter sp. TaxID=1909290 RepID=UPI003F6EBEF1